MEHACMNSDLHPSATNNICKNSGPLVTNITLHAVINVSVLNSLPVTVPIFRYPYIVYYNRNKNSHGESD